MPFGSIIQNLYHERHGQGGPPQVLVELLERGDVRFNGDRPWDIRVHDEMLYRRVLAKGSLGFGEAYIDGLWDCAALDELFCHLMRADIDERLAGWFKFRLLGELLRQFLFNLQSTRRAFQVGERHYDIGNDIFEAMLDSGINYSCGYWQHAEDLEQAQLHKLELICRKLQLQPGERLLEIGCGWGALMRYAAEHYAVEVVGVTVSKEQQKLAQARCKGLPVKVELKDYREMTGRFDKVVSVGMFEHVGQKNYRTYFQAVNRLLSDGGLFLLHTIGSHKTVNSLDPWMNKYIFPNGKLPSAREITHALEERFLIEDWHNFGQDYDRTLMAWWRNFDRAWSGLKKRYDDRFYRMWKYYLHSCAGLFRSRQGQLWQLVLNKRQYPGIYRSVR
ncbi:MAG: cyclopropane fatty acyl phospholipid synthase [Candidatus Thiodiazotropha sp. (ex Dulcina madagascariensis)]|nr:cyclopropane fatty acyl phospholipid synthase [Candidatus Thiodiazotropha sp. (ex Epidulcina cf. delphinae)]MCU7921705.1 cyclopropane fatty acyl phospholipid synthase [Candidatus Thiodiazotropha sp. (ex Dulcina madagascariensis)]MCU7926058.1 cyclopropane fatty acyl phospholipid synthase [Candidatus Thiodiazotropha sp. (ex Dulcina madagascariensis)]